MNYDWVQTLVMSVIFLAATLFSIKHFLPEFFAEIGRIFAGKNSCLDAANQVAVSVAGSPQSKCSACNGCSMARK